MSNDYKFQVPPGKTEKDVLESIEKAVRILAPTFVFGYYSLEDIQQEARIMGLEAMEGYDNVRPLDNFVYTHIRNRLCNLIRNKLRRNDPPCKKCHSGTACQADGAYCNKYASWLQRNSAKANLMSPRDIEHLSEEQESKARTESSVEQDAEQAELIRLVDEKLPIELRSVYLQMKAGVSVPKSKRRLVIQAVQDILKGDIDVEEG